MNTDILKHLDKNNLHHAYLIEGDREKIVSSVLEFVQSLGVKILGNQDFSLITTDSFKVEDARNLKALSSLKGFSNQRVFVISTNNFLLEAQNTLLKMFEEPTENTLFFIIMPDVNSLLKTFISRFYLISARQDLAETQTREVEKFISMPGKNRVDFIKELLTEKEEKDEEGSDIVELNGVRSKALIFLNALELTLHKKLTKNVSGISDDQNPLLSCHEHIFKVRKFLRMPGSSTKTLMESVALIVPSFKS